MTTSTRRDLLRKSRRLSLSKKPTCAELKIDLDAPYCVLAAAELFSMITRKFGLPTLTVAAKDYALQQLRGQGNITTGSVLSNKEVQTSAGSMS